MEFEKFKWASKYLEYLEFRQKGQKREWKRSLDLFLLDFAEQPSNIRRNFIDVVHKEAYVTRNYSLYLPGNLSNKYFDSDIQKWISEEPSNPIPYKWTYDLKNLQKSVELDPFDQIAISLLGKVLTGFIEMNQHEIPSGLPYNGSPAQDLELLKYYEPLIVYINDPTVRKCQMVIVQNLKACANAALTKANENT